MTRQQVLAIVVLFHFSVSLAFIYCPECNSHEGRLECHPERHHICNENEVCQIHAHEDPHGVAMETGCRPRDRCFEDERHDEIGCAGGVLGRGPHGCVWCCDDSDCFYKYGNLVYPGEFSTAAPSLPTSPASTVAPTDLVPKSSCYVCENAKDVSKCLKMPSECDFSAELCMVTLENGTLSSSCRSKAFCTSFVDERDTEGCGNDTIGKEETCGFCCETPGCLERLIPKLPADMTAGLGVTAPPPTVPISTQSPTTLYPLGPNGEFNCHVCDDARHLDDCLRHPTYCHADRNEVCMIEYDPRGVVHARCEPDARHCTDKAGHNPNVCLDGFHGHGEHCTYCCDTLDCFMTSIQGYLTLPPAAQTVAPSFNCHSCEDAHHIDDCLRHPTYCDLSRNEICMVEYDPEGRVHSRCEKDKQACLHRQLENHLTCSAGNTQGQDPVEVEGQIPGPPGPADHCVYCCETTECFHESVLNRPIIVGK